jgi:peptidoglycan hydrolase-like protein with peptidoglycan-binding domain/LysM repeat protein
MSTISRQNPTTTTRSACGPEAPTSTAPPPSSSSTPEVLRQPDVGERAALQRSMGQDARTTSPDVPAGPALNYDALLGAPPSSPGVGEVGPTLPPAQLQALKKQQEALLDAGVALYAMQSGQTLEDVAKQFDTDVAELRKLNPGLADQVQGELGASMRRLLAVPVGDSDVRATAGPVVESGPDAYKLASPTMTRIRAGEAVMQRGMGGDDVKKLQAMLNAQGARPPLALDGKFGPKTEAALKSFQQANGIQQTGVLGRQTLGRFDQNPRPIPPDAAPSTTGAERVDGRNLTGSAFGNRLGDAAERSARQLNSVGRCALGVNNALESLGVSGRGHAYQKAEQLERNPRFREVNLSASDLPNLPRGAVIVWGRSSAKPYGHVAVALGDGREASDHIQRQITGGRYGTDFGNGPDPQGRQFRVFLPA